MLGFFEILVLGFVAVLGVAVVVGTLMLILGTRRR